MFLKKNIIDFLYNVIKDEELEIYPFVKYVSMNKNITCENLVSFSKTNKKIRVCFISLNKKYFCSHNRHYLKACLLHEIGHAVVSSRSKIDNELYAQLWAINKANTMGLKTVVKTLIHMISCEWSKFDWNDFGNRRYILAYKKFKQIFNVDERDYENL